jgi:hypothetical protein
MAFTESLLLRKGHFLSRKRGRLFKKYSFRSLNGAFKRGREKRALFSLLKKVGGTCPHCPPRFRVQGVNVNVHNSFNCVNIQDNVRRPRMSAAFEIKFF